MAQFGANVLTTVVASCNLGLFTPVCHDFRAFRAQNSLILLLHLRSTHQNLQQQIKITQQQINMSISLLYCASTVFKYCFIDQNESRYWLAASSVTSWWLNQPI